MARRLGADVAGLVVCWDGSASRFSLFFWLGIDIAFTFRNKFLNVVPQIVSCALPFFRRRPHRRIGVGQLVARALDLRRVHLVWRLHADTLTARQIAISRGC